MGRKNLTFKYNHYSKYIFSYITILGTKNLSRCLYLLERDGREVEVDEDQEEGLVASEEDEAAKAMDNEVEAATAEVEVRVSIVYGRSSIHLKD